MGTNTPLFRNTTGWADAVVGCVLVLQIWNIWGAAWFVTLDGPCHLYNARLLLDLFRGDPSTAFFFQLNDHPDPYWSGQLLMAAGLTILPPDVVEKGVFSLALIGTVWAFRSALRSLRPQQPWGLVFVLPFLMHYGVLMGYINFMLSIPLLLMAVRWAEKADPGRADVARGLLLFTLLYFTHPSAFLVAALYTGIQRACTTMDRRKSGGPWAVAATIRTLLPVVPGMLLLAHYMLVRAGAGASGGPSDPGTLFLALLQGRAWNALGIGGEKPICTLQMAAYLLLGFFAIRSVLSGQHKAARGPLLCAGSLLVLYFLVPDVVAGGSNASPRILLFLMLFLALTIACTRQPRLLVATALVVITGGEVLHSGIRKSATDSLARDVELLVDASTHLRPGDVLHPIGYSDNWMHGNISNYIGTVHGAIVLHNFVATAPFAPVQWHPERLPSKAYGINEIDYDPCLRFADYTTRTSVPIEHVLTWVDVPERRSPCARIIATQLARDYRLEAASPDSSARLYRSL